MWFLSSAAQFTLCVQLKLLNSAIGTFIVIVVVCVDVSQISGSGRELLGVSVPRQLVTDRRGEPGGYTGRDE
jgi:hypothetical protein